MVNKGGRIEAITYLKRRMRSNKGRGLTVGKLSITELDVPIP